MFYSPFLSFLSFILLCFWTLFCALLQTIFLFLPKALFFIVIKIYFRGLVLLFGIKINHTGKPHTKNTLFISNHTSYLDIVILGSKLNALFVAKSEINNWPIINKLTKIAKTIFINRQDLRKAGNQVNKISNELYSGYNIIIFPEGTSNDGNKVLPFKSSLFEIIKSKKLEDFKIQPVSISYCSMDGIPINRFFRPFFAWYGGMDLTTHAWNFFGLGNCEIKLNFHRARTFSSFKNRKDASTYCFDKISKQFYNDINHSNTISKLSDFNGVKFL